MMTVGMCQLYVLQQRTYVFLKSPGYNFLTRTLKEFRVVRSKSTALNSSKNVFGRDLQLLNTKRYSSDQSSVSAKRRLPLTAKLLLVTSGAASIGYYTFHTTRRSGVLAKQWETSEDTVQGTSPGMSSELQGASDEYVTTKIYAILDDHGKNKTKFKQSMADVGLWPDAIENTSKIFSDPIHGNITIHPVCVAVINTPEFQRLRDLKQLGVNRFVYPGATHARFEHCLGVCYLAGKFVRQLKKNQPELEINNKDILCVELAGLCHDLGHGPFSHVFDGKVVPLLENVSPEKKKKWKHENASRHLVDYIYKEHKEVRDEFEKYGLDERDRNFIKALATGKKDSKERTGRDKDKNFLYEIVANELNGIDVDKWDYIARDCHHLGIRSTFDHSRFMKFARVKFVEKDGEKHICVRDKELINVYDLFTSRYLLYKNAYQHKVISALEIMVAQALSKADKHLLVGGKTISKIIEEEDWKTYTLLTDNILFKIRDDSSTKLKEAKDIIDRIFSRKFFKCVSESQLFTPKDFTERNTEKEARIKKKILGQSTIIREDDLFVQVVNLDFGLKENNPLDKIHVYDKNNVVIVNPQEMSTILKPYTFKEQIVRVYVKDKEKEKDIKQAFEKWIKEDFPKEKAPVCAKCQGPV